MSQHTMRRRDVIHRLGAGAVGVAGLAGVASADPPDRYIVGTDSPAAIRVARGKADAVHRELDFGHVGGAVAGRFSKQALNDLRARTDVRYVEVDGTMHAIGRPSDGPRANAPGGNPGPPDNGGGGGGGSSGQTLPWGIDRVDADVAHANGATGSGASIAIIDTGIDGDHPDLQANVKGGKAFVECKGNNCNYAWSDDGDHGTHCAGIADAVDNEGGVVGVSTEATLYAVKVLSKSGRGSFSDVADGIRYVADQGWDVGSMSLGASSGSEAVKDACQYAYDNGVLLVAAAGNNGPCTDCVGYPAAYDTVVAVSSTTCSDGLSGFSSTGPEVEIAAPGSAIYSTVVGGYDTFSGTSMATPHVAGAAAQLMASGKSNTQARSALTNSAEDVGLAGTESGAGLLDVAAALNLDSSDDGTGDGPNC